MKAIGKIIRCCADCAFFKKHKCQLGHNKESDPRDRFFDDCSLEDLEFHDAEVREKVIDECEDALLIAITESYIWSKVCEAVKDKKIQLHTDEIYDDFEETIKTVLGELKEQKECKKSTKHEEGSE